MRQTIQVVVFLFVFLCGGLRAQKFGHFEDSVEYLHGLAEGMNKPNKIDWTHQFKHIAFSADMYGFHHGDIFSVTATVPFLLKGVTVAPGLVAVIGQHETGPGAVVRWEYKYRRLRTDGTVGFYHPVKHKGLQFLGDPVSIDFEVAKKFRLGYAGEFGRYGKFGIHSDNINFVEVKREIKHSVELVFGCAPRFDVFVGGLVWKYNTKHE